VLAVIDAMKPAHARRGGPVGRAPSLQLLMERGQHAATAWPRSRRSRPVCSARSPRAPGPDRHLIPSMNWYHRDEERYVEYGRASRPRRRSASSAR
jgi:hypothetical protein